MSQDTTNAAWFALVNKTLQVGDSIEVRGSKILELENQSITVDPMWPFITYSARNYNIDYCKKELLWKLKGDPTDTRIEKYAKMWATVKNDDGTYNSNYGQYWFTNGGVYRAIEQLEADKHTRRASIPMLASHHIDMEVRDTVCTEAMTFLIRNDKLNCHVHMRSSDQIFGLGTDIPSFSLVQRIVLAMIKVKYPEVEMGTLTIVAASSHIYERHFKIADQIIESRMAHTPMCNDHWMPMPNADEAKFLLDRRYLDIKDYNLREMGGSELTRWLLSGGEL